ncbi:MAG TPA: CBS domain-containing protein [Polyangiaceae bacterium]|nr:CBS domain-containing protein [Polyangiaceae bacterium]
MTRTPPPSGAVPRIADVMTPFPYAIELDRHAGDAERMLAGRGIHHLPVTSAGEVYSVLSARDLELALARPGADPWKIGVRELCAKDPYIVDINEPLDTVLSGMADRRAGCAVVAQDDRVAGIFTSVDACRKFAEWLRRE